MEFVYQALDFSGTRINERLQAASEEQALRQLQEQGYVVLALDADNSAEAGSEKRSPIAALGRRKIKSDTIVAMTRELAIMIETGVPIAEALSLMVDNSENAVVKAVMSSVLADVSQGRSLSSAMSKHPHVFQDLYVSMVSSAEIGGTLTATLDQAAEYVETSHEMRRKVKGALAYPSALMLAMVGVLIFMVVYMVPRFSDLFKHMGVPIPPTFQAMTGLSLFLRSEWWTLPIGAAGTFLGFKRFLRWPQGNMWLSRRVLTMPIIGDMVRKVCLSRVLRALSTLLDSGVSMLLALETASNVAQNVVFQQAILASHARVESGASLHEAVTATKVFPGIVCQMVAVGEKSGSLTATLMHVAKYYEREVDHKLKALSTVIEPFMIVFLGIVVGFIAISIFTPLYSIYDNIK